MIRPLMNCGELYHPQQDDDLPPWRNAVDLPGMGPGPFLGYLLRGHGRSRQQDGDTRQESGQDSMHRNQCFAINASQILSLDQV